MYKMRPAHLWLEKKGNSTRQYKQKALQVMAKLLTHHDVAEAATPW
jgi:hypothetical protein